MQQVKIIRMITGEDIIGKVLDKTPETTKIKQAFVILPTQSAPGKPVQLMLTPYIPYAESDTIEINSDKVVTIVDPKSEILNSYQQNTSSILTASNSGLITETKLPKLDK